jgi:hypothetical protein
MAMQLNFSNILQFSASIAPILLASFLVLISIFNSDIKGLVYLGGVLIASLINLIIMNTFKIKSKFPPNPACNLIEFPFNLNEYVSPAFNSMFLAFTMTYLILPMKYISTMNYPMTLFMISLIIMDSTTKMMWKCTTISGILFGLLLGIMLGTAYFALIYNTHKDLLFFNMDPTNNVVCSRPKKQSFVCKVYKGGELIGTTTK